MAKPRTAPKFLNLFRIKLPVGGVASIGHRISGVLMFLAIPFSAWLFGVSLEDAQGFRQAREWLQSPLFILVSLLLVWSLAHHLLAGVRHLLLEIEIGIERKPARVSAWFVNLGAVAVTLLYLVNLL